MSAHNQHNLSIALLRAHTHTVPKQLLNSKAEGITHPLSWADGGIVTPALQAQQILTAALLHAQLVLVKRRPAFRSQNTRGDNCQVLAQH